MMQHHPHMNAAAGSAYPSSSSTSSPPDSAYVLAPSPSPLARHRAYTVADTYYQPQQYQQPYHVLSPHSSSVLSPPPLGSMAGLSVPQQQQQQQQQQRHTPPGSRHISPTPTPGLMDAGDDENGGASHSRYPVASPRRHGSVPGVHAAPFRRPRSHSLLSSRSLSNSLGGGTQPATGESDGESSDEKDSRHVPAGLVAEEGHLGGDESTVSKRRSRTLTTPTQQRRLLQILEQTRFPSTELREQLAKELGMTPRRVQIWFQNRRQGMKKAREQRAEQESSMAVAAAAATAPYQYHYSSYPNTPVPGFYSPCHTPASHDSAGFVYSSTGQPSSTSPANPDLFAQRAFTSRPSADHGLNRPVPDQLSLAGITNHHSSIDSYSGFQHPQPQHHPSSTSLSTLAESEASSAFGWSCASSSVTSASQPESTWMGSATGSFYCPPSSSAGLGALSSGSSSTSPYPAHPATWMIAQSQSSVPPNVLNRLSAGRSRSLTNPERPSNRPGIGSLSHGTIMEEGGFATASASAVPAYDASSETQMVVAPVVETGAEDNSHGGMMGVMMGRSRSSTDAALTEGLLRFRFDRSESASTPPVVRPPSALAPHSVATITNAREVPTETTVNEPSSQREDTCMTNQYEMMDTSNSTSSSPFSHPIQQQQVSQESVSHQQILQHRPASSSIFELSKPTTTTTPASASSPGNVSFCQAPTSIISTTLTTSTATTGLVEGDERSVGNHHVRQRSRSFNGSTGQ